MAEYIFKMPDIGEGIVEAEIVAWHVAPGEAISEDAPLVDVMTDKATVEITSPVSGRIESLGCASGDKMVIGAEFVVFSVADEITETVGVNAKSKQNEPSEIDSKTPPTQVAAVKPKIRVVPDGSGGTVPDSEAVEQLGSTGKLAAAKIPEADSVESGFRSGKVSSTRGSETRHPGSIVDLPKRQLKPSTSAEPSGFESTSVLASPAVRKLARDLGVELSGIIGSGPDGRVLRSDLQDASATTAQGPSPEHASKESKDASRHLKSVEGGFKSTSDQQMGRGSQRVTPDLGEIDDKGETRPDVIPIFGVRRLIAERMLASKQNIPHFSYVEEVHVDALEELRQHLNHARQENQPKLSLLHFILLGLVQVVTRWPQCNAHFDDDRSELLQYRDVHIGVATMTDSGLMVPVLRHVARLDIWAIASEVNRLASNARDGKLSREELTGSTITVTSLGALAGVSTTPVINRPETSIIGPNKMMEKLLLRDGQVMKTRVMNISSSFDHRVVDGYDAASMIQALKELLENPALLYME